MQKRWTPWAFIPTTVATLIIAIILTLSPTGGRYPKQDVGVVMSVVTVVEIVLAEHRI